MTLSEVLLLLTLLWDVMKGSFDIVMKLSIKEHDDNKKRLTISDAYQARGSIFFDSLPVRS